MKEQGDGNGTESDMGKSVTDQGKPAENQEDTEYGAEHPDQRAGNQRSLNEAIAEKFREKHPTPSGSEKCGETAAVQLSRVPVADVVLSVLSEKGRHFRRMAELIKTAVKNYFFVQIEET